MSIRIRRAFPVDVDPGDGVSSRGAKAPLERVRRKERPTSRGAYRRGSRDPGVRGFGVDLVGGDRQGDLVLLRSAVRGEGREHGDDDVLGIDLEVPAQGLAGVGTSEAIGAERRERHVDEARDLIRHRLHEVRHGDDRPRRRGERPRDVGGPGCLGGVETVPPLDLERVLAQGLVARRRPRLGRDVPVRGEQFTGALGSLPGRSREEDRRPAGRVLRATRIGPALRPGAGSE